MSDNAFVEILYFQSTGILPFFENFSVQLQLKYQYLFLSFILIDVKKRILNTLAYSGRQTWFFFCTPRKYLQMRVSSMKNSYSWNDL